MVAAGSPAPTLTFELIAPDGSTAYTETQTVTGGVTSYTTTGGGTGSDVASQVGTYFWTVTYSGNAFNNSLTHNGQTDPAEQLTTIKATPALTTSASATAGGVVGTAVLSDSVTVSGGFNPTGTVTFTLTQPDGTTVTVGTVSIKGDGTYALATTVPATQVGTYTWHASYAGDGLNNGAVDNGTNESLTTVKPSADLVLTKQVSPTQQMQGLDVTYTFILHNNGPDTATNVTVTDPFPAGVTVVGPNTASQGKYDPSTGIWTVGTLVVGATVTLTVTARVEVLGPITNTATAATGSFDPNLSNNTSNATVVGEMGPGDISKRFFLSGDVVTGPAVASTDPPTPAAPTAPATAFVAPLVSTAAPSPVVPAAVSPAPAPAVGPVSPAPQFLTAAPTSTQGASPSQLSGGGGGSAPQPSGLADGSAPVVQSEPPLEALFSARRGPVLELIAVPTLDAYLAAWNEAAAPAPGLPARPSGEPLSLEPAAAPELPAGPAEPARGEVAALAVAALLWSVAPRWAEARNRALRAIRSGAPGRD
jgi:uncharacterized repeat protein (TIGR01451 family)